MTVAQTFQPETDVRAAMLEVGAKARAAARELANAPPAKKNRALCAAARVVRERSSEILAANGLDCAEARTKNLSAALIDRLTLDSARIEAIARGLEEVAALPDPVGRVLATFTRPNGLVIERVATPLGVVGVIYESRPNVTADAGALCLKSGNAVVLRGGSDSLRSSAAIHACLVAGLSEAGLPEAAISRAPFAQREAVGEMLSGPRRRARRHRAARGKEPGRAGSARGAGAGVRPSRRRRACLCRPGGRFRQGAEDRGQRQDAPHRDLRRGRDAARASRGRPVPALAR